MWADFIDFRQKRNVDTITKTFTFPAREQVQNAYPQFYHKVDKIGRPCYFERVGSMDVKKIFEATTEEKMFENYIYQFEMLFNWRYPSASAKAGKRID